MKQRTWNALLLASGISVSAAFASLPEPRRRRTVTPVKALVNEKYKTTPLATSALSSLKASDGSSKSPCSLRTYKTAADKYFSKHGTLPLPTTMHAILPKNSVMSTSSQPRKNILVIGDVHGCLVELLLLHKKAVAENDNEDFEYVILVGDLCNKGPSSVEVVKHVRSQDHWLAVRGNHDDSSLTASLGDVSRRNNGKYQWVTDQSRPETTLTDEDVMFLADLPYSIRIPKHFLGDSVETDTLIVHAGLMPFVALEKQTIETMTTIRDVRKHLSTGEYVNHKRYKSRDQECLAGGTFGEPVAWAKAWTGPYQVIFGHDARRGYQRYEGDWAIGLDTGACYGKKLTGLILPSKTIVSIDSLETYCPIAGS